MSKLIKSDFYIAVNQLKLIETPPIAVSTAFKSPVADNYDSLSEEERLEHEQIQTIKSQIIQDAEDFAAQHMRQNQLEIEAMKQSAQNEMDQWWQEQRKKDEQFIEESKATGYEEGYQHAIVEAEAAIKSSYAEMIAEAQAVLMQAYQLKEQIIQEAEPFLIELSSAIAEKIIQHQLNISPAWIIELTQKILAKRKEKGLITICVAPQQFQLMQDAKDEFKLHIDSQAELQILPDATVNDYGCVIRSPFLSVDARIDTQLTEIKNALQLIAQRNERASDHE